MKKHLWLILGISLLLIDLGFLYLLYGTEITKEPGTLDLSIFIFSGIFGWPCIVTGVSESLCFIIEPLTWFGVGALVGWLVNRKTN